MQWEALEGFEWDSGNREKNWERHRLSRAECESIFFNDDLWILVDEKHSAEESRYHAFGQTSEGRLLLLVFCVRKTKLRIISGRDMRQKERVFYEARKKDN